MMLASAVLLCAAATGAAVRKSEDQRPLLYIGVPSGANLLKYAHRRDLVRKACWTEYQKHAEIFAFFFVGEPHEPRAKESDGQGKQATAAEQSAALRLEKEMEKHRDMIIVPTIDTYSTLPDKTIDILRRGVEFGAQYVMKHDDDRCLNVTKVLPYLKKRRAKMTQRGPEELYMGQYSFKGNEYSSMEGPGNYAEPFFSGPIYVLSSHLAELITSPTYDLAHTALYQTYGTDAEDADVGKWVAYARTRHAVNVEMLEMPDISTKVDIGQEDLTKTGAPQAETTEGAEAWDAHRKLRREEDNLALAREMQKDEW